MRHETDDLRITSIDDVVTPAEMLEELPLSETISECVYTTRQAIHRILAGEDDRLLVIAGPCSIHDPAAAREYASRLLEHRRSLSDRLLIVMRVYFEKPRTTVGWKGLINDPEPRRPVQHRQGIARRATVAARPERHRRTGRGRIPRSHHPPIRRGPDQLGGNRRAHHGKPGAPRDGIGAVLPGPGSRTARAEASSSPSMRSAPPSIPTSSSRSRRTRTPRSSRPPATRTRTSSCAEGSRRTTSPSTSGPLPPCWTRPAIRPG